MTPPPTLLGAGERPACASAPAIKAPTHAYVLILFTALAFLYQLDRNVIYVTQELIKTEYKLTDTEVGVITSLAFGVANAFAGFPLGWLNDRVNRVKLLSICVMGWSALTASCAFAGNFASLFLARFGTGATEAGGTPISLSLLTDLYPPEQRASKIGITSAGYGIGTVVSSLGGSYVAAHYGWRAAFLICGAPGVLLGLLLLMTMKEPARTHVDDQPPIGVRALPKAILQLLVQPGLRVVFLGTTLTSMTSAGVAGWWVSFMMRAHHLSLPSAGLISTVSLGVCAIGGTIAGGYATDFARRRLPGAAGPLLVIAAISLINLVFASIALWTPSTAVMIATLCAVGATASAFLGPRGAALSELAPPHLRGLTFSIPMALSSLIGLSIGGVMVGMLSDFVAGAIKGVEPLRLAMFIVLLVHIPVAVLYATTAVRMIRRARRAETA